MSPADRRAARALAVSLLAVLLLLLMALGIALAGGSHAERTPLLPDQWRGGVAIRHDVTTRTAMSIQ